MRFSPLPKRWTAIPALFALLAASPAVQAHEWDLQGKIGVGIPFGDLGDAYDPGVAFGLGLTRWLSPRVGFHLGAAGEVLGGANTAIPDLTLWHYNAGAEFDLLNPETSKFRLHLQAGLGATTSQSDGGGDSTDFTVNTGLSLEYVVNESWRILGGPDLYFIMADETQTVLPLCVGFRYIFSEP